MLPMAVAGDAEEADFTMIPDWALHWIHSVHNLHRYVGDAEEIRRLLPVVENVLRWFDPFLDDEGCLTDVIGWVIIDWASVHTEGVCAALNGLYARALLEFAELAEWLGDDGRAHWARAAAPAAGRGLRPAVGRRARPLRRLVHRGPGPADGVAARPGRGHRRRPRARATAGPGWSRC